MAHLKVLKGADTGRIVPLEGDRTIFGRHPSCHILLDDGSISRQHAQIVESHGAFFIEDLRSRNGTFVNEKQVQKPLQLMNGDIVRLCEFLFSYNEGGSSSDIRLDPALAKRAQAVTGTTGTLPELGSIQDSDDRSSIVSKIDASASGSSHRLSVKPETKLRAILEIGKTLRQSLNLDEMLPKILNGLFTIFPQADQSVIMLADALDNDRLKTRASKNRHKNDDSLSISETIVKRVMKTGEALLSKDAADDSRFLSSKSIAGLRIKSMMCVPLVTQSGDKLGVIQITTFALPSSFTEDDLDVLVNVAAQITFAIENATLHQALLKQRDMQRELEFAMQVQLGFLPNKRPEHPEYDFADFYEAAQHVGGDYYDYVDLSGGRIAVTMGDVAGKGVPAALLMARLYSAARFQLLTKPTLAAAMEGLNAEIATSGLGHRFITCAMLIIDPSKHVLTYVNAGHLPPLRRDLSGKVELVDIEEAGLPLGIIPDQTFQQVEIPINPGETWVLYTDGITEAMREDRKFYGHERLQAVVKNGPLEVDPLIKLIVDDVNKFVEGRAQSDDMCVVGFQRNP